MFFLYFPDLGKGSRGDESIHSYGPKRGFLVVRVRVGRAGSKTARRMSMFDSDAANDVFVKRLTEDYVQSGEKLAVEARRLPWSATELRTNHW